MSHTSASLFGSFVPAVAGAGFAVQAYRALPSFLPVVDAVHGGRGVIAATVKEKSTPTDTPLRRRVRLFHEFTGRLIRETWSDAETGNYSFVGVNPTQLYTVVSYDHTEQYRAVIADRIQPEPMP